MMRLCVSEQFLDGLHEFGVDDATIESAHARNRRVHGPGGHCDCNTHRRPNPGGPPPPEVPMDEPDTYTPTFRDRVAHRLANAALRLATDEYRTFIRTMIVAGMDATAAGSRQGQTPHSR